MSRATVSKLVVVLGGMVVAVGVALTYVPAGIVVAGVVVATAGLLLIEDGAAE